MNDLSPKRKQAMIFIFLSMFMVSCASQSATDEMVNEYKGKKEMAITIDDLPVVGGWQMSKEEKLNTFTSVVDAFDKYGVKAQGFVIGKEVDLLPEEYFDVFINRGHRIDNHTFSHLNLNEKSTGEFINDIQLGEKAIVKWQKGEKFFRYPMLVRGNSMEKRREVEGYLKKNGYTIVPVTIDSNDWKYNNPFVEALKSGDREKAKKIGMEYMQNIQHQTAISMKLSQKHEKRQVKHILLIHMNKINSVYMKNILEWYHQNGWTFVSLPEAMEDPVYAKTDNYVGEWGQSWLQMLYGTN